MSRFAPTLRLDVTAERMAEFAEHGIVLDDITRKTQEFFQQVDLSTHPKFTAERITDIETGDILTDYQSTVIGLFTIDGLIHIKTAMGDVVAIKFYEA